MYAAKGNQVVYVKAHKGPKKYDSDAGISDEKIVESLTRLAASVFASEEDV